MLIDQIEGLPERPAPSRPEEEADRVADPLLALRDLERAIRGAAEQPALQLVGPARPHRYEPFPDLGLDIHQQHQAYQQLHQPGPSVGIEL
jgi:hypothetical protein